MLSEREKKRYHRQLMIPNWGEKAQLRIKKCSVFVAGAGGLGSPVSLYLAVAGVGKLIICDYGQVKLSNLNRQILHTTSRIGENKAISAHTTLTRLNPDITVLAVADEITESTIDDLVGQVDLIVDCLDNFKARHLLNRYAVQNHIPLIYCGIHGMQAQLTFINPPDTPCLWCIFPGEPPQEQSLPALGEQPVSRALLRSWRH